MKIPESVRIAGVEYAVCYEHQVIVNNRACYGSFNSNMARITISNGEPETSHERNCVTLWHEILHGIEEHYGMELPEDEREAIIERFANGIYQVLQDNGRRMFDIKEPTDAPPSEAERTSCVKPSLCSYYSGFGCNLEPNQRPCKRKEPGNGG